jgi:hypothetical protein
MVFYSGFTAIILTTLKFNWRLNLSLTKEKKKLIFFFFFFIFDLCARSDAERARRRHRAAPAAGTRQQEPGTFETAVRLAQW